VIEFTIRENGGSFGLSLIFVRPHGARREQNRPGGEREKRDCQNSRPEHRAEDTLGGALFNGDLLQNPDSYRRVLMNIISDSICVSLSTPE
jgi:hypothetical protein